MTTVSPPYVLRRQQPRVAVLSNVGIASSGEATLIAFRQRANTRSFGQPTCGLVDGQPDIHVERRRDVHDHDGGDGAIGTNKNRFGDSDSAG